METTLGEVPDVAEAKTEAELREAEPAPGRDTPPIHQKVAVTAIMFTEPTLGTA